MTKLTNSIASKLPFIWFFFSFPNSNPSLHHNCLLYVFICFQIQTF